MRYAYFQIENFKGIQKITIDLEKSPQLDVYTLVGLNESGKTTILEAINEFTYKQETLEPLKLPRYAVTDLHDLIPVSKRDNFNDSIIIEVKLILDANDERSLNKYLWRNHNINLSRPLENLTIEQKHNFVDSKFESSEFLWTIDLWGTKGKQRKERDLNKDNEIWKAATDHLKTLIPPILYFPNFLFDFPNRIYLEDYQDVPDKDKHKLYRTVIQDILDALGSETNIETHILTRVKSGEKNDKRNLESLLLSMGRNITSVVFDAWGKIFHQQINNKEITINCDKDEQSHYYLEFKLKDSDGVYLISERSLGFRWFFVFLLLTQYRAYRQDTPHNLLFLFDEPASNLHATAQSQLLSSLDKLTDKSKVIYTTHSHHLINPKWLEGAFVVKNEGLDYEHDVETYSSRKTNIIIERYRSFAVKHPNQTTYFQPILDILDYCPSKLEMVPDVVMCEGKNDFYGLNYFEKVIFYNKFQLSLLPSASGSGGLDHAIQLYLAWNKNFIVLLDSDTEGTTQKERYINQFGPIVINRIFTLQDINKLWEGLEFEGLFTDQEKLDFQRMCYPHAKEFHKGHFNRALQENFIKQASFEFSEKTQKSFSMILQFLSDRLKNQGNCI